MSYAKQGKGDLDKQDDLTQKREICEIYERETDFLKHPYDFTEFDGWRFEWLEFNVC